jgi:hypothetical protein
MNASTISSVTAALAWREKQDETTQREDQGGKKRQMRLCTFCVTRREGFTNRLMAPAGMSVISEIPLDVEITIRQ